MNHEDGVDFIAVFIVLHSYGKGRVLGCSFHEPPILALIKLKIVAI